MSRQAVGVAADDWRLFNGRKFAGIKGKRRDSREGLTNERRVLLAELGGRRKARRLGERFGETRVGREVERRDLVERFRYFSPREAFRQDVDRAEKGRIAAIDDSSVRNFRRKEPDAPSVRSIQRAAETAR